MPECEPRAGVCQGISDVLASWLSASKVRALSLHTGHQIIRQTDVQGEIFKDSRDTVGPWAWYCPGSFAPPRALACREQFLRSKGQTHAAGICLEHPVVPSIGRIPAAQIAELKFYDLELRQGESFATHGPG